MRRIALPTSVVFTAALSVAAYAATTTVTSTPDFNNNNVADNLSTGGGELAVATLTNTNGDWYRKAYDGGATYGLELDKDAANGIWTDDDCLDDSANLFTNDIVTIGDTVYRMGPFGGTQAKGIAAGTTISTPTNTEISEIKFLTHGSRSTTTPGTAQYTVTVNPGQGTATEFVIDILDASTGARSGSGDGTLLSGPSVSGSWSTSAFTGFTNNATSECGTGDNGDEVTITLPAGFLVDDIRIDYVDHSTAAGAEPSLGGPFALSTDAIESDIESDFTYRASYESANTVADAVSGGGNTIWYAIEWDEGLNTIIGETDVFLYVRCATDTGNGTLANNEFKDFDGGSTGSTVWQGPFNLAEEASPYRFADCTGEHLQYQLEFYPEFDVAPVIEELRFVHNPDYDEDTYPAETVAGHNLEDCDDNAATGAEFNWADADGDGFNTCQSNGLGPDCDDTPGTGAAFFPGASVNAGDVSDGLDRDCDEKEECFADGDDDNFGNGVVQPEVGTANMMCDGTNEAPASVLGLDCEDGEPTIFPGAPIDATDVGDGFDGDCMNGEECFVNDDGDDFGTSSITDESNDADLLCEPANGEATQDGDCLDTGTRADEVYPGKTIVSTDIDDNLDNNCSNNGAGDECWDDDDDDGFGNDQGNFRESTDKDCNDANESTNNLDCRDTGTNAVNINPGITVTAAQIDNDIDDNCSSGGVGDECWLDDDGDGFGNDDGLFIDSPDISCTQTGEAPLASNTDCLDDSGNAKASSVFPGATIDPSDIDDGIDSNCSHGGNGEECWADADDDGFGNDDGIPIESADSDCLDTNEAVLANNTDCLDTGNAKAADVFPGAPLDADDVDDNIDGNCSNNGAGDECWLDDDGDGFGNDQGLITDSADKDCADAGEAPLASNTDCLDDSGNSKASSVFPGATVTASGVDDDIDSNCSNNGNGDECWADADGDGFGTDDGTVVESADKDCLDANEAILTNDNDCLDSVSDPKAPDVFPGATITAAGIDDDIDSNCSNGGAGDECWADADGDGFGADDGTFVDSSDKDCTDGGEAALANNTDCLDDPGNSKASSVFPGATVTASGVDDDIDSNCSNGGAGDECWADADSDGFGTNDGTVVESADKDCNDANEAVLANNLDCLDSLSDPKAPVVFPGASITLSAIDDDIDSNCSNGGAGDECWADLDNDGFGTDDGSFVESADKDCTDTNEAVAGSRDDCLDSGDPKAPDVFPNAPIEQTDIEDGIDSNCSNNGSGDECWRDADNDNFGNDDGIFVESDDLDCDDVNEHVTATDCLDIGDPKAPDVFPGASIENTDIDDNIDSNCSNGGAGDECWEDADGDGVGNDLGNFVEAPDGDCLDGGEALTFNDCNDTPGVGATVQPGKVIGQSDINNNLDNDCDGANKDECWEDEDADGYGDENPPTAIQDSGSLGCIQGEQESDRADDCDDDDNTFNPGIDDTCSGLGGDGIDNNCDGAVFDDEDGGGDGLTYAQEQAFRTDDCLFDSDGDNVDDFVEFHHDCGPNSTLSMLGDDPDTDGDGVMDGDEDLNGDTDGDGIRNPCDPDDDGDGIPTLTELAFGNTDAAYDVSDTIPDYLDDDDDNDGLATSAETGDFPDSSGLPDYRNEDDDGDGLLTLYERSFAGDFPNARDRDQDGEDNHRDTDSDGDGFLDSHEASVGGVNFDGDNQPDFLDFDSDGDTVLDADEGPQGTNTDGTGLEDRVDTDDDDDGLSTQYENSFSGRTNPDGDNNLNGPLWNWRDTDSDNDGFPDAHEDSVGGANFDGMDDPDFLDFDSDNDGVPDVMEGSPSPVRNTDGTDGEDRIDDDDDGDSVPTATENAGWSTPSALPNFDGDSFPDYRDDDDDDDGIDTIDEIPRGAEELDQDGDGPNYKDEDSDGDGWLDSEEQDGDPDFDFDSDGLRDFLDTDSDNDTVDDINELNENTDRPSSGAPNTDNRDNRNDDDDDGDGIPTASEHANNSAEDPGNELPNTWLTDFDGDGDPNYLDLDADGDTVPDAREWVEIRPNNGGNKDSDGDSQRDFLDLDSDNDSIDDEFELDLDADSSGGRNRVDADDDGDGVPTILEGPPLQNSFFTSDGHTDDDCSNAVLALVTNCVDYLDNDDDDDGIATSQEYSGEPAVNTDGLQGPDYLDRDDDEDSLFTLVEPFRCSTGGTTQDDHDGDGTPDHLDNDDDGDGLLTAYELAPSSTFSNTDVDGDGNCNHRDEDSDNDGFEDSHEEDVGGRDYDGDGIPDFVDTDSDNDTVDDVNEGPPGRNSDDGIWQGLNLPADLEDRVDIDDDNDWIATSAENHDCNGQPNCADGSNDQLANDWDNDGTPNFLDADDDNDGIATIAEWFGEGTHDVFSLAPSESPNGAVEFDGDGSPDFIDTDDDGDTIPTIDERLCGNGSAIPLSPAFTGGRVEVTVNVDTDGDGDPNHNDIDDDGDTLPTAEEETYPNVDGDGCRNAFDLDSDNDDWPDEHELTVNTDQGLVTGDNLADFVDNDSDGDGVSDSTEFNPITDPLAGYPGAEWDYTNHVWISPPPDRDNDGQEDRLDVDDDGDGIDTYLETYDCGIGDDGTGMNAAIFNDMLARNPEAGACVTASPSPDASRYDWDGDGYWNYLDPDDDNDNVPTLMEDYDYPYVDANWDHDSDPLTPAVAVPDDGLLPEANAASPFDAYDLDPEIAGDDQNDTDGDGAPNFLDVDDDGDGIATILEDWDSPNNPLGTNSNPHGDPDDILDVHPRQFGDNLPDFLDNDDDGDGLLTANEVSGTNSDPRDENNNAQPTSPNTYLQDACVDDEVAPGCYDDVPDFRDVDDEGDGVPTWAENLVFPPANPLFPDTDGDGILDGREWINFLEIEVVGIPDPGTVTIEQFAGLDVAPDPITGCGGDNNSNGIPDRAEDTNGDGVPDMLVGRWWFEPWDRNCDTEFNFLDVDDDGDGFPTNQNGDNRNDEDCATNSSIIIGDGIPNYLDIDSDNQSITVSDSIGDPRCVPGSLAVDTASVPGGPLDSCELTNDDEEYSTDPNFQDADGDDIIDPFDCIEDGPEGDDDGDKIPNYVEARLCQENLQYRAGLGASWPVDDCGDDNVQLTNDQCGRSPDSDCDGVLDCEEAGLPVPPGGDPCSGDISEVDDTFVLRDSDGDTVPDMFDRDDDNDTIETSGELAFLCGNGAAGPGELGPDLTGNTFNGWRWFCVDVDGQRTGDFIGATVAGRPSGQNTDRPGGFSAPFPLAPDELPDYLDVDDDGDERLTADEGDGDQDGDGLVNYLDPYDFDGGLADPDQDGLSNQVELDLGLSPYSDDSDGDGIPDDIEVDDPLNAQDTDGDGLINALDSDDDGDGIPSAVEGLGDQDGDGIPNYLDLNSDSPGNADLDGTDEDETGPNGELIDSDCDTLPDFLDATDDSDIFCVDGTDTGTPVVEEGCGGCSSSGPSGLFGMLGLFALGLMRRRQ